VPLKIFTQVFGIKGQWLDEETINIIDPITLPYYSIFNEIHSIDRINQVFLFDVDSDGKDEMYVTYYDYNRMLQLAAFTFQGQWLYDSYLEGISALEMAEIPLGKKKALIVMTPGGAHTTTLHVFTLNGGRLVNIDRLDLLGNGSVAGNEIKIFQRYYDTAGHGFKLTYCWDETTEKFVETSREIFYWFDYNQVDLKNAESIVCGFCEAIAMDLEKEALSYCAPDIRFAFGKEGLGYSVKHPIINIRRMIDHFKCFGSEDKLLQVQELGSSEDRKLFLAYYVDIAQPQVKAPVQVYRLVLKKVEELWQFLVVNFLYNQLPTEINFSPEVNFTSVYSVFSMFTCHSFKSEYFVNVKLSFRYPDYTLDHECFIDRCTIIELVELLPGVQLSFFREDLRLCYFTWKMRSV